MKSEDESKVEEKTTEDLTGKPTENLQEKAASEPEFKIKVRKLEMPQRPRGVLAE